MNRECMREARQRRRLELQEMQTTVSALEKQYKELSQRSAHTRDTALSQICQRPKYAEAVDTARRLGAENLYLQSLLKQEITWERQLQRIVDFEEADIVCGAGTKSHSWQMNFDVLDDAQAEKELGFHRLTDWDFTRIILDNKRNIHHVESRLLQPSNITHTHRMQAFGWDMNQTIDCGVMEFVFTKQFSGLNVYDILRTTLVNDLELERSRKIKAETLRLQVIQEMAPNAFVVVHDVSSTGDVNVFRSVVARFLIEDTRDFPLSRSDLDDNISTECRLNRSNLEDNSGVVTGRGCVLGTHSVTTDKAQRLSDEELSGKLVWADVALSVGIYDVIDSITGETCQYVRWAGRTDYSSEEHAQRNASDTVQCMLRWEMLVIAPALNLVSIC
ncbi:uncharacterized protein PITG_13584 [Phytophthora infestans T30-4]|uniref:Uncharacterized protein n=1 Tax=Phytophthora infestans (strain T30-4) TaxID=403677 RepID=D0NMB9_PHYIT|nr:uncharacterized protein PITG_13584 [Phytophthora infestans T30-4]EEY60840.1 conserved hypothetical protein [Phytophthora infestans T30-4]|eukprot:XP_002899786.1 conserved hypothetical protein [Phytophthora infestans T30-4]